MRRLLLVVVLLPLVAAHGAPDKKIDWVTDFKKGLDAAQAAKKPVLAYFWADWCPGCKQLDEKAFSDDRVIEQAARFLCVRIDIDKDGETPKKYGVNVFPDVRFLKPGGEEIAAMEDTDVEALAKQMKKVADEFKP